MNPKTLTQMMMISFLCPSGSSRSSQQLPDLHFDGEFSLEVVNFGDLTLRQVEDASGVVPFHQVQGREPLQVNEF